MRPATDSARWPVANDFVIVYIHKQSILSFLLGSKLLVASNKLVGGNF